MTATAAIMIVGNEILSGRTQDVNVQFIAQKLADRGVKLAEVRVVRDEEPAIVKAAQELSCVYDFVFSTGGIGPTHDDITVDCVAKAFNAPVEVNTEAKRRLTDYYATKGIDINEARLRMARIPVGAHLIENSVSIAPGFRLKNIYVMAGVPKIMQAMFMNILPELPEGAPVLSSTISCGLREGDIAVELEAIQKEFPDVEIGSYPGVTSAGEPHLSLVLRATDEQRLKQASDKVAAMAIRMDNGARVVA